jgi:hypothetical protein
MGRRLRPQPQNPHAESREGCEQGGLRPASSATDGAAESLDGRLCDRWSSGGPAEETADWMAVTRARSASQPGAGADSSTPNPGKPFGTRSPLYRCWPHRLSTSGGNDAGVLRKLGPQKPKAPPVATLFLRWSSAAPAASRVEAREALILEQFIQLERVADGVHNSMFQH